MSRQIIKPNLDTISGDNTVEDPMAQMGNHVAALLKWASMVDQRDMALRGQLQNVVNQFIASLEAISLVLVDDLELTDKETLDAHRQNYLDQVEEAQRIREEEAKKVASKIWTPDNRIVPAS